MLRSIFNTVFSWIAVCEEWLFTFIAGYVNTELGRANEALTSFVNGVDDIVQSPTPSRKYSSCDPVSKSHIVKSVVKVYYFILQCIISYVCSYYY